MIGVGNHAVLTDPHFGVQALRGKFVRSCPPPPSLPAGFDFSIENSLGAIRDRGSGGRLRAKWICEYDPVVRGFQRRSDLSLLPWVQPVQFTMTGLSSRAPHVIFAPLRALEKKGGVVRPVLPM